VGEGLGDYLNASETKVVTTNRKETLAMLNKDRGSTGWDRRKDTLGKEAIDAGKR